MQLGAITQPIEGIIKGTDKPLQEGQNSYVSINKRYIPPRPCHAPQPALSCTNNILRPTVRLHWHAISVATQNGGNARNAISCLEDESTHMQTPDTCTHRHTTSCPDATIASWNVIVVDPM